MIHTTDKATTETTAETEDTSNNRDMIREIKTTKTGMITTKIETGLTIEEDQTNTNTTETILIRVLGSEYDGNDADGKRVH